MLFDLRSPNRKRMVQLVYLLLAVVLIGGTLLFGVGTGLPGLFSSGNSSNGQSVDLVKQQNERIAKLEKAVALNPKDAKSWAALATQRYNAGVSLIPQNATTIPAGTKAQYTKAADAWNKYLALNPDPIDQGVAQRMVTIFTPDALNRASDWADAQGILTAAAEEAAKKSGTKVPATSYLQLLAAQVQAKRTRQAKITAANAKAVASPSQKSQVVAQIKAIQNPTSTSAQAAAQAATAGTSTTVTLPDDTKK